MNRVLHAGGILLTEGSTPAVEQCALREMQYSPRCRSIVKRKATTCPPRDLCAKTAARTHRKQKGRKTVVLKMLRASKI